MTYYEELGLTASAAPDEIRKAHRTVCRLLHPDQQTEDSLRQAAELQMRRLNAIVDILLDPQQRRRYDESLRAPLRNPLLFSNAAPRPDAPAPFSLLDLIGIVVAAVIVTLVAIWFFAGDFIHWRGPASELTAAPRVLPASTRADPSRNPKKMVHLTPEKAPRQFPGTLNPQENAVMPDAVRLPPPAEPKPRYELTQRGAILPRQNHFAFPKPPAEIQTGLGLDRFPLSPLATPPPGLALSMPAPETAIIADTPAPASAAFTGLWLLSSSGKAYASSSRTRQAPQYIQISLHRGVNDTIYGQYSARYEVPDRPISPEVAFTFQGPVMGNSAAFDWEATDGSSGALELKLLNPQSMQVTWHVVTFGSRIGIAGGAAVVIRNETR
jgi:hypothetical protein